MKHKIDIIIIGAGASGLFLAKLLKNRNFLLLENNQKIATKLRISGGGRCNITNEKLLPKNYFGDQRFIRNIIKHFDQHQLLSWLNEAGLIPELRKDHQYFCKDSSQEIINIFQKNTEKNRIKLNIMVKKVEKKEDFFEITTSKGIFFAKNVVVASGGLSFPKLGASSIGYDIATSFGHTIVPLKPALVGFTVQPEQFFFKSLSGVSMEVGIKVEDKLIKGDLLFAHKGISGPAVLNASLYWEKGKITIDFLPNTNLKQLHSSKKKISNLLGIPSRVAKAFLEQFEMEDKPATQLSQKEWATIASLKEYAFAPAGTFGYSKAEVTRGGVATDEIDASSMMSKKVDNLYFLGEVLDVTGELGGYNFQWAFSTAYVCSKAI